MEVYSTRTIEIQLAMESVYGVCKTGSWNEIERNDKSEPARMRGLHLWSNYLFWIE